MFDLITVLLLPLALLWVALYQLFQGIKTARHWVKSLAEPEALAATVDPCATCKGAGHCSRQRQSRCPKRQLTLQGPARWTLVKTRLMRYLIGVPAFRWVDHQWQHFIGAHPQVGQREWLEPRLVVVTAAALAGSFAGTQFGLSPAIIAILHGLSIGAGAFYALCDGLLALRRRRLDIDLLMVLFALCTGVIGYWNDAALLLFLFSFSQVLQNFAVSRNRRAIASLIKLHPNEATVLRAGQPQTVALAEISRGEIIRVKPGDRLPVDGVVRAGGSFVDQSAITGESLPVWKPPGALVYAGTLNQRGTLDVEVTSAPDDTLLARIIKRVEEAQTSRSQMESFVERFEQRYTVLLLVVGGMMTLLHLLAEPGQLAHALEASMILLTVASPCALVMSAPTAFIAAIAAAARAGILFKGSIYLERLAEVKAVVFDKTGTLTIGHPVVTEIIPLAGWTETEVLRFAAALESHSEHPLAQAILAAAQQSGLALPPVSAFEALPGWGVRGVCAGFNLQLSRPDDQLPPSVQPLLTELESAGKTVVVLQVDGAAAALFALADALRPGAGRIVAELQAQCIRVVMLTGDNARAAHCVAHQLGIDAVYAELLPDDKIAQMEQIQAEWGAAVMVGDGVNDAPALAHASVSIAMGQTGTDVTLETADVVLMGDQLELIGPALRLSRQTRRVVWQNIVFALAGMLLLIGFVLLTEDLPLPLAVLGHEGGTVLVVSNSLMSLLLWPGLKRRCAKYQPVQAITKTVTQLVQARNSHHSG